MDPVTIAFILILCYTVYYYYKNKYNYFEEYGIPYLPGVPIFGNMASSVFKRKHITQMMQELYQVNSEAKYVGFFDFSKPVLMIRDLELIKTVGIKNFDNFTDHRKLVDDSMDPLVGNALLNLTGAKWREVRNLLSPAFTSSKMKTMYELIVDCTNNFVNYVSELPSETRGMLEMKNLFNKLSADAIATCAFGLSIDSLKNPNNEFYLNGKEAVSFSRIHLIILRSFGGLFKFFNMRLVSPSITKFFTDIIKTTIETRDREGIRRPDMLQLLMDARKKDSKSLEHDILEITAQAFIFFFGGFDTTSLQMSFLAHELAVNLSVQEKLQEDIDAVMKKSNGSPTYDDIMDMPYLDAIFNETLRKHAPFPFVDRTCTKTFELPPSVPGGKPFTIQPGMIVWFASSSIHKDPKYYEDPEKFFPERYYGKKVSVNDATNLGFGIGPRGCIGNRFAIMETKILFFFLLHKFSLKPNKKTCIPMKYNKARSSVRAENGFWLAIEPRKI